jgi:hypothetical protein
MGEWGDTPPTFDRASDAWGSSQSAFGDEGEGGGDQYVEMIGSQLWVAGTINLGRFRRVSDFVNIVQGYLVMRDVMVLTQTGESTRLTLPELRVLPDDIAVVGQHSVDGSASTGSSDAMIEKRVQRLVVVTRSHMIDGDVFIHGDGTIMSFVDATDPKFIPMTDVRVRWVSDRKLAARYPFALVQRAQILGVATEGIKLGDAATVARRAAAVKAQPKALARDTDTLDDEVAAIAGTGTGAPGDEA